MKTYGFAKSSRLHLRRDFDDVFANGKKVFHKGLVLWYKPISRAESLPADVKMAVVVSKKLGLAPQRNRAKRLIREVFRLNKHKLSGVVLIMSPRSSAHLDNFSMAQEAVLELWLKAKLIDKSVV